MKLLVISDAHANPFALRAIERAEKTFDRVCFAGDFVDYGPFPRETIAWFRERDALAVFGNHDLRVLNLTVPEMADARARRMQFWAIDNAIALTEEDRAYLRALPETRCFTADGIAYQIQHRYRQSYALVESLRAFDELWQGEDRPLRRLIFGHTHRRLAVRLSENAEWVNPGSVSYRRGDDPDKRAHYLVIEDGEIRFGAVEYDRSELLARVRAYHESGTMKELELQNGYFFFGDAQTDLEPLPSLSV